MANIAQKVAAIRQAIFGKDVRESIASGIESINSEVENTTARQNVIDSQEQTRINAENIRLNNENTRQNQEQTRINNENTRQNQEQLRSTMFNTNEQNRSDTFNTNENTRQTTFNTNENDRGVEFASLKNELNTSIDNANEATVNTNIATSNYMDMVEQTKKIYKPTVNSYSDMSTTYPNPEIGWTVVTKDTGVEYRWDGVEWVDIGVSDVFDGYNIVLGSTPPNNPNLIWLDTPENTRYSRVIPSAIQPDDISQIWWETDN